MPLVFLDSVFTVFSSLPCQSTRQALSLFCSATHSPSCDAAIALGKPSGLLKSVVVFTLRDGRAAAAAPPPVCAPANFVPRSPAPTVARNSRRSVRMVKSPFVAGIVSLLRRRRDSGSSGLVTLDRRRRER